MVYRIHRCAPERISLPAHGTKLAVAPDVIIFDLDETLYPRQAGIMQAIGRRITAYLEQFLGLSHEEAMALRQEYIQKHGTTLRGLQIHRGIDADHYLEFVHDVPVEELLRYDERLDRALESIDASKVVFTNASREHAERVLQALGIRRHFCRIVDIRDMDWVSKPHPSAYPRLLALLNAPAERCMLVEDNVRNLRPAAQLGMITVLVDAESDDEAVHYVIDEVWQIAALYAALRRGAAGGE